MLCYCLILLANCQSSKNLDIPATTQKIEQVDSTWISDQKALAEWLMSQSQQVRDDFKRDFVFSGEQLKQLVDTLKNNTATTVKIGAQVWASENLESRTFRNGDSILQAQTDEEWQKANQNKQAAWCYCKNSDNKITEGILYNFYALIDPRGLAPIGWRIPSNSDWSILFDELGGLKQSFYYLRMENNSFKSNPYFGHRRIAHGITTNLDGTKDTININSVFLPETCWWSSDELSYSDAFFIMLSIDDNGEIYFEYDSKGRGCSIRCLKE